MFTDNSEARICQGEVVKNISCSFTVLNPTSKEVLKKTISYPYAIVLNQDCDLSRDFENRFENDVIIGENLLHTILICPLFNATSLRAGNHLEPLGVQASNINSRIWSGVKKNSHKRYHYLAENEVYNLPELVMDFKHTYSFPTLELYNDKKLKAGFRVKDLYREDISQRFSYYLSRIALPEDF